MQGLILPFGDASPRIADDAFLAPGSIVIGDVEIGAGSSVWYGAILRGDVHYITVGAGTNIQDGTVVHVSKGRTSTEIGDHALVGHMVMLHGCRLLDHAFIGMRATLLDGVVVEPDAMVAAGALVTPNKVVKSGQLWAGSPAHHVRDLTPEEIERNRAQTRRYAENAQRHRRQLLGVSA